jgi:hypothetical protein
MVYSQAPYSSELGNPTLCMEGASISFSKSKVGVIEFNYFGKKCGRNKKYVVSRARIQY